MPLMNPQESFGSEVQRDQGELRAPGKAVGVEGKYRGVCLLMSPARAFLNMKWARRRVARLREGAPQYPSHMVGKGVFPSLPPFLTNSKLPDKFLLFPLR